MKFYYVYKALAHPEQNGYVTPFTLEERLMHVAEAKKQLGTRINWICDSMQNDLKHALGDRPNSEFLVSPEGEILVARQWSRPDELREDLEKYVGEVRRPTTIADLKMKPLQPPKTAPKGVVPRLRLPGSMQPVIVEPIAEAEGEPFYVKLRAEVDSEYPRTGTGRLYLGFFPDPLYSVHWNNRAAPVSFEIESTGGVVVADDAGTGPEVEVDADADPREFLVDLCDQAAVPGQRGSQELIVTVRYIACDDAETFCKPVTQSYRVVLQRDPDGGSRRSPGNRSRATQQRPRSSGARPENTAMRNRFNRMSEAERREFRQRMQQRQNRSR